MHYVYVYLNPLKRKKFKTSLCDFDFEPIYVGKGKGSRIYHHLTPKILKTNNHRYNLISKIVETIGLDEYKKKYVVKVVDNLPNETALEFEYLLMSELGTRYNVHPAIKNGPLLNFTLCGVKNPVLYGDTNPMHGLSIYDVWEQKYPKHIVDKMKVDLEKIRSINSSIYWETIKNDSFRYSEICAKIKAGVDQYWKSLSNEKYSQIIESRSRSLKEFYKKYGNFENYYVNKYGIEDGLKMESVRRKAISDGLLEYWKNIDKDSYDKHSKKTKKGLEEFYKKYGSIDEYLIIKLGSKEFKKRKDLIRKKLSKAHLNRWKNTSNAQRNEHANKIKESWNSKSEVEKIQWSLKYSGKNNPMYKNGDVIKGKKNGRATQWIIHTPNGEKYYCNGSFKRFCKDVLRNYKPQPHRKYLKDILDLDEPINGWYFKKVGVEFDPENKYIIYE